MPRLITQLKITVSFSLSLYLHLQSVTFYMFDIVKNKTENGFKNIKNKRFFFYLLNLVHN